MLGCTAIHAAWQAKLQVAFDRCVVMFGAVGMLHSLQRAVKLAVSMH
jgi:hypothetical protein